MEKVESWRNHYNGDRPHSALGNLSPREFAVLPGHSSRLPSLLGKLLPSSTHTPSGCSSRVPRYSCSRPIIASSSQGEAGYVDLQGCLAEHPLLPIKCPTPNVPHRVSNERRVHQKEEVRQKGLCVGQPPVSVALLPFGLGIPFVFEELEWEPFLQ